ncbi:MAG: hypothetical protein JW995_08615, partial [Melioribacteraceae bacterium]|nr:hypothetical protein [Melioribacteraceae bacterium]
MFFFLTIISSIFLNARVGINGNEDSLNQKANVVSVYLLNGYAVAYSIHSNSNLIIRLHLDFNLSLCDENLDESIITDISVSGNKRISEGTRTDNNYSTSLGNYYLLNLYDSGKLSFYEGGG